MALEVPWDVPSNAFIHAGLMALDGDMFEGGRRIGSRALSREIDYVKLHIIEGGLQTRHDWQQIRNVCLIWCFSYRTPTDSKALDSLLRLVGLNDIDITNQSPHRLFDVIEQYHNKCSLEPMSPLGWIKARPPPQRLPIPGSQLIQASPQPQEQISLPNRALQPPPPSSLDMVPTFHDSPKPPSDFNTNPKFQGRYHFTDHKQEYEGFQFQCIYRCLKDGKHCRKAPVREMNRHLRERHQFRPGFKIAGVDWDKKRWRGAGADHEECVGRIVEKDSADDSDDGSEGDYIVR